MPATADNPTETRDGAGPVPRREPLDSRTRVVTPENIAFEYRAAGPFTRLGAYLIDIGVQLVVVTVSVFLFVFALIALFSAVVGGNLTVASLLGNLGAFTIQVLWFVMQWFYGAWFEYRWNGQTPGKRALGLRVLQTDGRPLTLRQAVLRNVARVVDAFPPLPVNQEAAQVFVYLAPIALSTHLLGFTAAAVTKRHQRLGDLISGTMVVAEDRAGVSPPDPVEDARVGKLMEVIPASFLPSRPLAKALSHYMSRRRYFGPARRQEIARHVAGPLLAELRLPPDTDGDLLLCALYLRSFGGPSIEELLERTPVVETPLPPVPAQPRLKPAPAPVVAPGSPAYRQRMQGGDASAVAVADPPEEQPAPRAQDSPEDDEQTDWERVPLG